MGIVLVGKMAAKRRLPNRSEDWKYCTEDTTGFGD